MDNVDIEILEAMDNVPTDVLKIEDINTLLQPPLEIRVLQDRLDSLEKSMYIGTKRSDGTVGSGIISAGLTAFGRQFLRKLDK